MPGEADSYFTFESLTASQTKVKSGLSSSMKYPMNIMLVLLSIPKMLGNDLVTNLNKLKGVLEK